MSLGICPECKNEDEIYLVGEVKLQLTKEMDVERAHFYLEDIYVRPARLRKPNEECSKFRCENCQHIFDEPEWVN